jgi:hypothetical protein
MSDTLRDKVTLKGWFETDDIPTQSDFDDLITTMVVEGGSSGNIDGAVQVGDGAEASAVGALALGSNVSASNVSSLAIGSNVSNSEPYSIMIGNNSAKIRILSQGGPVTPNEGDIWFDGELKCFTNNITYTLTGICQFSTGGFLSETEDGLNLLYTNKDGTIAQITSFV